MNFIIDQLQDKWSVLVLNVASQKDIKSFLSLFDDFFQLCEGKSISAEELLTTCPPPKNPKKDKLVLGIYRQEKLVGLLDIIRDYPEKQTWTIGYLLIHPEYRCRGIGHRFLQDLENVMKIYGIKKFRCVVQQQNPKALKFWQQNGFVVVEQIVENLCLVTNKTNILEKIL